MSNIQAGAKITRLLITLRSGLQVDFNWTTNTLLTKNLTPLEYAESTDHITTLKREHNL